MAAPKGRIDDAVFACLYGNTRLRRPDLRLIVIILLSPVAKSFAREHMLTILTLACAGVAELVDAPDLGSGVPSPAPTDFWI